MVIPSIAPRTALFLPASNPRAIAKARTLSPDMIILDLEDAVRDEDKSAARAAAVSAVSEGFGATPTAIRLNGFESEHHAADIAAIAASSADFAVLPKAEDAAQVRALCAQIGKPVMAMIETPMGVLAAPAIAALPDVVALLVGTNDLAAMLHLPPASGRASMSMALQSIVLAARAGGAWALDGVFNKLDDPAGLGKECREGRALGFDGKTLIHPYQIDIATEAFSPSELELAEAEALIAAATGGAERYQGRMIEAMHVDQARALLARAKAGA